MEKTEPPWCSDAIGPEMRMLRLALQPLGDPDAPPHLSCTCSIAGKPSHCKSTAWRHNKDAPEGAPLADLDAKGATTRQAMSR